MRSFLIGKMMTSAGSSPGGSVHVDLPLYVRIAQWFYPEVFVVLLLLSLGAAVTSFFVGDDSDWLWLGPLSASTSALAAVGLVLHDRPRVLWQLASDVPWDSDLAESLKNVPIEYETGGERQAWLISPKEHKKGRAPVVRVTTRESRESAWREQKEAEYRVMPNGEVLILHIGPLRTNEPSSQRDVGVILQ